MPRIPRNMTPTRYYVRWVMLVAALVGLGLTARAAIQRSFGGVNVASLLTCAGLVVGTFLIDINLTGIGRFRRIATTALITILVSQACYLLLVWTGFKTESLLWRIWWVSAIGSVTATYILVIRRATAGQRGLVARGTVLCVALSGVLAASLGLRRHLVSDIDSFYLGAASLPLVGVAVGTFLAWLRWMGSQDKPPRSPMTRGAKIAWLCGSYVGVLMVGLYIGRAGTPSGATIHAVPSALRTMPAEKLEQQAAADLDRLKTIFADLDALHAEAVSYQTELRDRMAGDDRAYYLPEEEYRIRWYFVQFLTLREALLRLASVYGGYEAVSDPGARARCFILGYTATLGVFHAGANFVHAYGDRPEERRKLNEPEVQWGLRAGLFDEIEESVVSERNARLCAEMGAYYRLKRDGWRQAGVLPVEEFDWLRARIEHAHEFVETHRVSRSKAWFERIVETVRRDTYEPVYAAQSLLAELIGDIRIVERAPYVAIDFIEDKVAPLLEPGDIILERRNWFLSNAFLPGFWPHGALYVGTMDDLRELGIADAPEIRRHAEDYLRPAEDGRPRVVIEAVSEGVVFNSLTHSLHADYVAVLRPCVSKEQKGEAIKRAFTHYGKDYDFEFDFFTSDKLVCTELIYRAYEGILHFDLARIMGRDTFSALQLVQKYADERRRNNPELEFVLFLDADPATGQAKFADEDEFCASADRPRAFTE